MGKGYYIIIQSKDKKSVEKIDRFKCGDIIKIEGVVVENDKKIKQIVISLDN